MAEIMEEEDAMEIICGTFGCPATPARKTYASLIGFVGYVGDWDNEWIAEDAIWWVSGDMPTSGENNRRSYSNNIAFNKRTFSPRGLRAVVKNCFGHDRNVSVELSLDGVDRMGRPLQLEICMNFVLGGGKVKRINEYTDTKKVMAFFHTH
ncbi:hypothetical protein PAPYR_3161 [Paratrimastix pyriformis]|uniref:SnoaL-like domain-containing protein n=1 Tax=Paratrimastix pyriformis TaxID=342808 RepID=A0ABQ8UMX8_9EUKA|nr:hypothetical protein PAPYR_3161 [Paratrimastix pyriformis]